MGASSRSVHIPALDGLRGIAILLVLAHHLTSYGGFQPQLLVDKLVYLATMAGWSGVDLFFVLSGFLITGILYDSKGTEFYFRNFYIRRCLRIFPLYYGVLVLFLVVLPRVLTNGPSDASYQSLVADQAWYWAYLINVKIALDGWPKVSAINHFWSLAVEEQFYLVWPFLIFLCRRDTLVKVCVACVLAALGWRIGVAWTSQHLPAYVLLPARMDALAIGGLLALLARDPQGLSVWRRSAGVLGVVAGSVIVVCAVAGRGLWTTDPLTFTIGYTALAIFFGATLSLVVTSAEDGVLGRICCSRLLRFFGRYSYGLYVFHHPIVIFTRRLFTAPDLPTVFGSQLSGLAIYVLLAGGASLAVAMLSWHLYEAPFLRLKERFSSMPRMGRIAISQV
jgi:peptidoglycan/LPS O-acetylase OafA/YrhL